MILIRVLLGAGVRTGRASERRTDGRADGSQPGTKNSPSGLLRKEGRAGSGRGESSSGSSSSSRGQECGEREEVEEPQGEEEEALMVWGYSRTLCQLRPCYDDDDADDGPIVSTLR